MQVGSRLTASYAQPTKQDISGNRQGECDIREGCSIKRLPFREKIFGSSFYIFFGGCSGFVKYFRENFIFLGMFKGTTFYCHK